jgi:hypothetical protein
VASGAKRTSEQKLKSGEIVPVDIELYPSSTFVTVAETLQLIVASYEIIPSVLYRKDASCNHGNHVLHFGGEYDSYLLIPKVQRATSDGVAHTVVNNQR